MPDSVIKLKGVKKRFQSTVAVENLDLEICPGIIYGFLGPNGAGKTTTIRMLTGILLPDSGDIQVLGHSYNKDRRNILNRLGYIPDRAYLYPKLTGLELLNFLGSLRGIPSSEVKKTGNYYFEMFELQDKANELIERYSHGMRQKLILITALMHSPDLIIVDEPMVGLDPRASRQIKSLFKDLASEGKTIFMSTHSLDVAEEVCDRIGIIHRGKMVADDRPDFLIDKMKGGSGKSEHHLESDLEAVFLALTQERAE